MASDRSLGGPGPPHPGVRIPPPLFFVAGFLIGLACERWMYRLPLGRCAVRMVFVSVGWLAILVGLVLVAWAMITFVHARTPILPFRPANRLVRAGPYRFSRNPMYVALSAIYVGLAFVFSVSWPLVFWPLVLFCVHRFIIRREERYLSGTFGGDYAAYQREVNRWL